MNKVKAVIFDFNGTLFFDTEYHNQAWQQIVKELLGVPLTDDIKKRLHGSNNRETLYLLKPEMTEEENKRLSLRKEQLYREICLLQPNGVQLVKGAVELFEMLQERNIPFTIASASIKENIDFFIETFSLDRWFNTESIVYDNGTYQDKEMMFKDASRLLHVNPEECMVIEDSYLGILTAKKAGVKTIVGIHPDQQYEALSELGVATCISDFEGFPTTYF